LIQRSQPTIKRKRNRQSAHARVRFPDKSIIIHLSGLHLELERGVEPTRGPLLFQRLTAIAQAWPHFLPPANLGAVTVFLVAPSESAPEHIDAV
jgi:hypothetical protein